MNALNPDDVTAGKGNPAFDVTGLSDSPRVRPDGGLLAPMISYAQNLEDVMLRRALQDIGRGFYVDIGACDPDTDSVTRWFYENGWRGINVDPDPQYHARLVERRPEDTNLQCVIGAASANVLFNIATKKGWSTGSAKQLAEIARRGDVATRPMLLPAVTLDQLLALSSGRTIDFLKIDAEGMEKEILDGTCFALQRPRIIVAEATLLESQIPCHQTWEPNLLRKGYKFAWFDGLNRFYVRCEDEWRLQLFKVPPCVFDHFFGVTIGAKLAEAERERERLQAAISEHEAMIAIAEAKASAAEASVAWAQAELAAQRGQVADLERERDEGAAALARLEAETAGLRARIDERDAALAAAEGRAGAAEARLAEARDEFAAQRGRFSDLEREGNERTAALAQVEAEAAGLRVRIGELAAVTATTAGRASAAEAGFAKARNEITQLREAIDRAEADIRQRGAVEFALRGDIESLRRALNRAEQQRNEQAEEVEPLRREVAEHRAAAVTAQSQIHNIEARLAEAQQEIEARQAQLALTAEEKAAHESVVGTLKTEVVALRTESSATAQVGHELIAASTADVVAPEKRNQSGNMRAAMLGFVGATRTRAVARGDRARDAKQWQLAARHYRKALARDPLDAPCWVQYGHALKEFGCWPEAEAAYRRSLALAPSVADTHLQLGHVLKLQGRAKAAQAAYLRAFALDPEMLAPSEELAGLGWSPTHLNQMRGLLAKPEITQLRSLRDAADAARDRQDWPQAAKLYQEFVTGDPTALDITVQLGHALKEMGDLDRAAQAYYGVLEANPLDDDLHLQIGHLEKLRRDFSAAAAHYQQAAQINPANAEARRESEALRNRVREARPGAAHTTGPARRRSESDDGDELAFLDARASELYQQLLSAMA